MNDTVAKFPVTVAIVTRNRCALLADCLESLRLQTFPAEQFEILVLDDGSEDDTRAVVERFAATRNHVRHCAIRHSGTQGATNASVRLARANIIAWADDDTLCDPNWLQELVRPLTDSAVACVGGAVKPRWEAQPPAWIYDYKTQLALLDRGPGVQVATWPYCVNGCNMAARRDWYERVGGVNPELVGAQCFGDGETGLLLKLWQAGGRVLYNGDAVVHHRIPAHRMTREYMRWRFGSQGYSDAYTAFRRKPWRLLQLGRMTALALAETWFALVARLAPAESKWSYRADFYVAYCKSRRAYESRLLRDFTWREMALIDDWTSRDFVAWLRQR